MCYSVQEEYVDDVGGNFNRGRQQKVEVGISAQVGGTKAEAVVGAGIDEPVEAQVEGPCTEVWGAEEVVDPSSAKKYPFFNDTIAANFVRIPDRLLCSSFSFMCSSFAAAMKSSI